MFVLQNPSKDYAWGDPHRIPEFLGQEPTGGPVAEVWIGTHPSAPSSVADGRTLPEVLDGEGDGEARLPFLLKLLAAGQPLSLQVHPDARQAAEGYAREEREGPGLDDPARNFKDPRHKPEMMLAVDEFRTMSGFRDPVETAQLLTRIGGALAERLAQRLGEDSSTTAGLEIVFHELLAGLPDGAAELLERCQAVAGGPGAESLLDAGAAQADSAEVQAGVAHGSGRVAPGGRPALRGVDVSAAQADSGATDKEVEAAAVAAELAQRYPEDPGWLISLLLNQIRLYPGEAVFIGAGVPHAHLRGFGVELMAESDNVLRAGLTPKHRDLELVRECTAVAPEAPHVVVPEELAPGLIRLAPPVEEFAMLVADPGAGGAAVRVEVDGPRVVLCLEGALTLSAAAAAQPVEIGRGQAVFVPASEGVLQIEGPGRAVVAVRGG